MTAPTRIADPSEELRVPARHLRLVPATGLGSAADSTSPPPMAAPAPAAPLDVALSDEDQWWLEALRRGEGAALTRLYNEQHGAVRALVRRLLLQTSDVEDIVHDVFVAAPNAFRRYRGEGSIRSFLFTIAVNYVRHHVRAKTRRRTWLERLRLAPVDEEAPPQPDRQSERRELADRLRRALAALTFDHRTVVVLCEVEEMTAADAALVLGVPEGTVRTRLHYAKKKLRAHLGGTHE